MFTDFVALLVGLIALKSRHIKIEIWGTIFNALLLLASIAEILSTAWHRLDHPALIHAQSMLPVALVGLIVNMIILKLIHHDSDHLTLQSTYYHVLGDTLSSIGVIIAGIGAYYFNWLQLDTWMSFVISILLLASVFKLGLGLRKKLKSLG